MSSQTLQPKIIKDSDDTLLCFTIDQSKFLLDNYYKSKSQDSIISNLNQILTVKDSIILNKGKQFDILNTAYDNQFEIIRGQDLEISTLELKVSDLESDVTKLEGKVKLWKNVSITIGACAITSILILTL